MKEKSQPREKRKKYKHIETLGKNVKGKAVITNAKLRGV